MRKRTAWIRIVTMILAVSMAAGCSRGSDKENLNAACETLEKEDKLVQTEPPAPESTVTPTIEETVSTEVAPTETDSLDEAAIVPEFSVKRFDYEMNDALKFVQDMKVGWNLGNTMDAHSDLPLSKERLYESYWSGVLTTKEMIEMVKEAGFRTIRIPVSWHNHVDGGDYTISEAWMDRVQEIVDYAFSQELYVILNIHHDIGEDFYYPDKEHYKNSKKYVECIWKQVAERFKDYGEHLIFETINEPRLKDTPYEWSLDLKKQECMEAVDCINRLNQDSVDVIRAASGENKTRYIMAPGYCASPDYEIIAQFQLPEDLTENQNKIIVSTHAYTPYNFALRPPMESGSTKEFSIKKRKGTHDIEYFMDRLYHKFIEKGTPVVIGEFGARNKGGNLSDRTEYTAYYVKNARARGISCVWWDNNCLTGDGEQFCIFDRRKKEWPYPEIRDALVHYSED